VVLALDLEDVLPPSAAQQLSSKIVFHHVVHLVVGQSVGNVPLQSVVRVSQRHPEPKSHDYPVDATVLRAALDQRGDQDILGECPSGEEKASEEESEDEAGVSAIPVVDDLYEGGGVDDDGVGLVVEAGLAAEEVVVAVELEAVHPAEEVVVRSPGHQ